MISTAEVYVDPVHKLSDIVHSFARVKALVIGDAMIDQYHYGRIDRISPEAPVPIFVEDYEKAESRRGGADNVAHQLEALGCEVRTIFPERRSVKHRYMVGHYQVFRRDSDSTEMGPSECELWKLGGQLPDVIVLSDYAKGFLTESLCQGVILLGHAHDIPVVVDPHNSDWGRFDGADVLCPNSSEMTELPIGHRTVIVEKRGKDGLRVWQQGDYEDFPAMARHVFDVTGAGDTVTAVVAATLGCPGETLWEAAKLANLAAGYVVGQVGTTVCPKEELLRLCESV